MKPPKFAIYADSVRCPDRHLLAAILARAILDLADNIDKNIQDSAKRFIMSSKTSSNQSITFEYICEHLDLSSNDIRKAVFDGDFNAVRFAKFAR